jgi:hypothetical protein
MKPASASWPPLNLRSLAIRLQIGAPEIRINLHWLRRQRELIGEERFGEILREHLDADGATAVLGMMEGDGGARLKGVREEDGRRSETWASEDG